MKAPEREATPPLAYRCLLQWLLSQVVRGRRANADLSSREWPVRERFPPLMADRSCSVRGPREPKGRGGTEIDALTVQAGWLDLVGHMNVAQVDQHAGCQQAGHRLRFFDRQQAGCRGTPAETTEQIVISRRRAAWAATFATRAAMIHGSAEFA
jgi:hypothetical protein